MDSEDRPEGGDIGTRSGYVALVGRPNVGKSSLLNALVGEKLSIVTPRAQTTRDRVMGIYTTELGQIIFVDTPGLLMPKYLLQHGMLSAAHSALADADLVLLLLDPLRPDDTVPDAETLALLKGRRGSLFVAINKSDAAPADAMALLARWCEQDLGIEPYLISAVNGDGVTDLRDALLAALPPSPYLYPPDDLAVQPVRFFVAEFIRETIFEECHEEVPYSTAVGIEEFREASDPIVIRAVIYVERESQKAIVIGRGGLVIKTIGQRARAKIEDFLGAAVYLDLWVKALPRWRKSRHALRQLGYALPPESGSPKS
jgi:GTP-binding protein Era